MKCLFISMVIMILIFGCKTTQMRDKKREGLWVEFTTQDSLKYKSIGKYHQNDQIKNWRYYLNGKLIKKEKYKKDFCISTNYFENGKIQSIGKTKLIITENETHWFYTGEWNYYDQKGKLIVIKKYENGDLISEKKSIKYSTKWLLKKLLPYINIKHYTPNKVQFGP